MILVGAFVVCTASLTSAVETCRELNSTTLLCEGSTADNLPRTVYNDIERIIFNDFHVPVLKKKHLENFPSLRFLNMKQTKLEKIEDDVFDELKFLSWVDFSMNNLTNIDPNIFAANPALTHLNVSGNPHLVVPKNSPFLNASSLKWLGMQSSGIEELYSDTFVTLSELRYLFLGDNRLSTIPFDLLKPLKNLYYLDLSGNPITSIALSASSLPPQVNLSPGMNLEPVPEDLEIDQSTDAPNYLMRTEKTAPAVVQVSTQ